MKSWLSALGITLLAGMAGFVGYAAPANAGQLASVAVVNQSTGERLSIWRHGGRNYVAGNPGERYALEVRNQTGGRLLSVVSVDGVNVISGATASPNQSGYVVDAWQSVEIKGWRKNMDEVAAFYFTRLPDSYAARTGRPENVGVIGVALFREASPPRPLPPVYIERDKTFGSAESGAAPAPADRQSQAAPSAAPEHGRAAKRADERLGTGHGERIGSGSEMTDFKRESQRPNEIISIFYDTHAHLVARGIIPGRYRNPEPTPAPFPGGFVPDPN